MIDSLAVPLGMVGAASVWAVEIAQSAPFAENSNWILQASGVGLVIAVAFWLIQRSDKRETEKETSHALELRIERELHEKTRVELREALMSLARVEMEMNTILKEKNDEH